MSDPFDFFDAIFCMNLNSRPDRWQECLQSFEEYNIDKKVKRFSAARPEYPGLSQKFLGKAGCSYSHFLIAQKAQQEGYENYLVLEDDFQFRFPPHELRKYLHECINQLPVDWDLLYLGCNLDDSYGLYPIESFSDSLFRLKSAHTTHAMAFNKKFIEKFAASSPTDETLVDWTKKYEVIDVYLSRHVLPHINAFVSDPLIAIQRPSFSDIEGTTYNYVEWMLRTFEIFKNNLKLKKNE